VNVIGHGIDLVDVAEMRPWIEDPRDPLIPRCFVQAELDEIGDGANRIERLAGRFAAKQAVLKALGTGFCAGSRRQLPIRTGDWASVVEMVVASADPIAAACDIPAINSRRPIFIVSLFCGAFVER
jgi:phosphopantetheine--protein transferase-like protein